MKEELMRRISAALDTPDGLAGDPALQEELRADPQNAKYAKDLTRLGKWLAVWPLPEPDDAAFEALAGRIEQRLDEPLGAISDPTAAPSFEDDDALRDATASLLQSGEYRVSDSSIERLSSDPEVPAAAAAPPSEPKPLSPIAKVALGKARMPSIVEEHSGTGEPLSAAELQLRLENKADAEQKASTPAAKKKKKKKKKPEGEASSSAARAKSGDHVSISTSKPSLGAPPHSPVVQLPKAEEKRPAATFWWFAAAAAVGIGVFGAATLFESQSAPMAESAQGSTLVTSGTVMPTAPAAATAPVAAAPIEATPPPAPPADREDLLAQVEAVPVEQEEQRAHAARTPSTASAAPYAPMRIAERPAHAAGGTAAMDDLADPSQTPEGAMARRRSAGTGTSAAGPTTPSATPAPAPRATTTTTAMAPPPTVMATVAPPPATAAATTRTAPTPTAPEPADTESLPDTPDRSTIQAVLEARSAAVAACANGAHGLADIDIVIASTGRITTATVNGTFAGTAIGSCMARAVRGATFPPFSQPRFEVTYPYHL